MNEEGDRSFVNFWHVINELFAIEINSLSLRSVSNVVNGGRATYCNSITGPGKLFVSDLLKA